MEKVPIPTGNPISVTGGWLYLDILVDALNGKGKLCAKMKKRSVFGKP
jgi:hypothetical protein